MAHRRQGEDVDHTKSWSGLLLAGMLAAAPLAAAAADEIFLRLEGVKGESVDARHMAEIELLSYTQTMTGPNARGTTSVGAGAGKTTCGPVTVMKYVDQASPDLILYAMNGRPAARAVITFRKSGQGAFEYYRVTLENVVVTQVEQSNSRLNFPSPAPPRAIEKVSLMSQRLRFEYYGQQPDGRVGAAPKAGWDCAANAKL